MFSQTFAGILLRYWRNILFEKARQGGLNIFLVFNLCRICYMFFFAQTGISLWYWWNILVEKAWQGRLNISLYVSFLLRLLLEYLCGIGGIFWLTTNSRGNSMSYFVFNLCQICCMLFFVQTMVEISLWYWRNILVDKARQGELNCQICLCHTLTQLFFLVFMPLSCAQLE